MNLINHPQPIKSTEWVFLNPFEGWILLCTQMQDQIRLYRGCTHTSEFYRALESYKYGFCSILNKQLMLASQAKIYWSRKNPATNLTVFFKLKIIQCLIQFTNIAPVDNEQQTIASKTRRVLRSSPDYKRNLFPFCCAASEIGNFFNFLFYPKASGQVLYISLQFHAFVSGFRKNRPLQLTYL